MKTFIKRVIPKSVNDRLSKTIWEQLAPSWKLQSGLIIQVKAIAEWAIYNDIFVEGEYDLPIDMVLATDEKAPFILDIGANVGYFSIRFADRWFREKSVSSRFTIIGFEGSPVTYSELQERTNQPVLSDRCRYYFGLIGKRTGTGYISTSPFHVTDSIITPPSRFNSQVEFLDLDSLIPSDQDISLLKCDIEGAEEMFLENYPELLKRVRIAVFEMHPEKCNVSQCFRLLNAAGLVHHSNIRKCDSFTVDVFRRTST
jgi:FkbM family methyltransferase